MKLMRGEDAREGPGRLPRGHDDARPTFRRRGSGGSIDDALNHDFDRFDVGEVHDAPRGAVLAPEARHRLVAQDDIRLDVAAMKPRHQDVVARVEEEVEQI